MRPVILFGIVAVVLALAFYTAALVAERGRRIDGRVLSFLALGVLFDLGSTTLMVLGARGTLFTLHGVLGFSALGLMVLLAVLASTQRSAREVPRWLHLYFRMAYVLWLAAFASGVAAAAARRI